ncbi:MAG: putative sensor protein [Acidobacteria bacterium]|nr:putative sensor protein [Acidobacteriota bacterium]
MQRIPVRRVGPIPAPTPAPSRDVSLRLAFDGAGIGLATATIDGNWLRVNDVCCQLLGYTRDELLRYKLVDLTHPEDAKKELVLIKRVLAGDAERYRIDKRIMDKRGSYRMLHVTAALAENIIVYVIEPPAKPAETGHDAGRLAHALLERLPNVGVVRTDPRGNITGWNAGAERILGYPRDEIVGKNRRSLYRDEDSWEDRPLVHMRIAAEQGQLAGDDFRVDREGKHVWLHSELTAYAPDGTVRGYIEVLSPQDGLVSIDTSSAMESLRRELERDRAGAAKQQEEMEQLMLRGAQYDQELRILAGALRKEIERRGEAEELVRGLVVELATPSAEENAKTLPGLDVEPSWAPLPESGVAGLLLDAAVQERTGTLIIAGPSRKALFFQRGRLTSIASDDPADFLGERLVRTGTITAPQRAKALQLVQATGLAFGRCLVLLGILTDEEGREAMRAKLLDEIDALAAWHDCQWSFVQRELPHRKMLHVSIDVRDLPAVQALRSAPAFVATKNGTRYHRATCPSVRRVAAAQQIAVMDAADAAAKGLDRCRMCQGR